MLLMIIGVMLYFVPTVIAVKREKHNRLAIAGLNIVLGWTVIGWGAALVWALLKDKPLPQT